MATKITNPVKGAVNRGERLAEGGVKAEKAGAALAGGDRTTNALQSISSKAYGIWGLDMLLAGPAVLLGMGLSKMGFQKAGAALKMVKAPLRALNETSLENIHRYRGNVLHSASVSAQLTGGKAQGMTEKLRAASKTALADDARRAAGLMDKTAPARHWVGGKLDAVEGTGFGGFLKKQLDKVTNWRVNVNTKKAPAMAEAVHGKLEGFLNGVQQAGKEVKPKDLPKVEGLQKAFKPLEGMLTKSKQLLAAGDHAAHALHLEEMGKVAMKQSQQLAGKEAKEMMRMGTALSKAATGAAVLEQHKAALGGGLKALTKNLGHMGGRLSVLQAVVAVGAVTGAAAAWTMARHQNKTDAKTLHSLTDDLGGDKNHPIVAAASKTHQQQKGGRMVSAAAQTAGEAMTMGFTTGAGGPVMMAAQMGLPGLANMMVPENQLLNAYATLQEAERTGKKIETADKIEMVKHLVAAVPAAAQHGGVYARLTAPTAEVLVKRDLPLRDMMKVLGDPAQFETLAREGKVLLESRQTAPKAANENIATANDQTPSTKIGGEKLPQGRVTQAERAIA